VTDYLRYLPMVLRQVSDEYDLVHANYGLTGPYALLQRHLPVVLSLWGSDLFGPFGPLSRWCARGARETVVMSPAMADALGTDCHVVPHGVDLSLFRPRPQAEARAELGWADDRHHVLFPYGTRREEKDYPRAERVVAAADDRLDATVVLQQVTGLPHEVLPTYMNAADALLLTSRREGSPNSVKEALACNLPVVSTDVGDVRERLEGVTPSRVCTGDRELVEGLVAVLADGGRSDGRRAAREVSLDRMGERLLEVYRTALDGGG
jgi:glycosyltransferase involved in cell wall biosynthesis